MLKKVILGMVLLGSIQCTDLQTVSNQIPGQTFPIQTGTVSNQQIGNGLKQALDLGIQQGVQVLGQTNGFYSNDMVKILFPPELQKVEQGLRSIGMGGIADEGVKLLNRAAEDAVTTAGPIFTNAVQQMNFTDARNILLGGNNAATQYLQSATTSQLQSAFQPQIQQSLGKVGADKVWKDMITRYNQVMGAQVNPDLSGYVTEQAINGVFTMVAQKEQDIRQNVGSRTTNLLQEVFALQDR